MGALDLDAVGLVGVIGVTSKTAFRRVDASFGRFAPRARGLLFRSREYLRWATAAVNESPVFILGNQKSGTSAIVTLLGKAADRSYTSDIFCWFGDAENRLLQGEMLFDVFVDQARFYFSHDLVKEPGLTFMTEPLCARFPNARVVLVVRDPATNIRGILNRVELPGDLEDLEPDQWDFLRERWPQWLPVFSGISGGCEGYDYIETLARRAAKALALAADPPSSWITVRYEDFMANKLDVICGLASQLRFPVVRDIRMDLDRPYQPPSRNRASPEKFFGHRNLRKIEAICAEPMAHLGYSIRT